MEGTTRDPHPNHIKNDKLSVICLKNEENNGIFFSFLNKKFLRTKISFARLSWGVGSRNTTHTLTEKVHTF